jgi:hypothetical protein
MQPASPLPKDAKGQPVINAGMHGEEVQSSAA